MSSAEALPKWQLYPLLPLEFPKAWQEVPEGRCPISNGIAWIVGGTMSVIASLAREEDGRRWLHVSLARPHRLPSWDDLKEVKRVVLGPGRLALQVLPTDDRYINLHPYCLHLWSSLDGDPVPDFARGGAQI